MSNQKRSDRFIIAGTAALALCSVLAVFVLPTAPTYHGNWWGGHVPVAIAVVSTDLFLGSTVMLLHNLRLYRKRLQQAYQMIAGCAGLVAAGAALSMYQQAANTIHSTWALALTGLPFVASGLLCCLAARSLGSLVGYSVSAWRIAAGHIGVLAAVTVLIAVIPNQHVPDRPALLIGFSNTMIVLGGIYNLMAGWMIIRISRHMGAHYTHAVSLLGAAFCMGGLTVATYGLVHELQYLPGNTSIAGFNLCAVIVGILFIRANYIFVKLRDF
ncbi:MAG TPA: hypothetical protein VFT53_00425 [Candidatus Saccharimonadales bacterium]|nr:hypothetical protein [Candidatus Saccharimonadales bacterium]